MRSGMRPRRGRRWATSPRRCGPCRAPGPRRTAPAVRTNLTTELGRIDVAISSRMATFAYTAPDNATIAAIRADTINLPDDPASEAAVAAIYNSTLVVKVVPTQVQRPTSGTATYRV